MVKNSCKTKLSLSQAQTVVKMSRPRTAPQRRLCQNSASFTAHISHITQAPVGRMKGPTGAFRATVCRLPRPSHSPRQRFHHSAVVSVASLSSSSSFHFHEHSNYGRKPERVAHHFIGTARSISNSSSSSWSLLKALRLIIEGDDHINPKKLLERRYLYSALLATTFRALRLEYDKNGNDVSGSGDNNKQQLLDDLYERAIHDLDAKGLDRMSNVQLRQEMQLSLEPQVVDIFHAFHRVDENLGIGRLGIFADLFNDDNPLQSFQKLDWKPYKDILLQEYEQTASQNNAQLADQTEQHTDRTVTFLERKRGAIECLLDFHGWSAATASVNPGTRNNSNSNSNDNSTDHFGMDVSAISSSGLELIRSYQTINFCRSALIRKELGYSILTLKSLLPGAGRGTFVDGKALSGSLIVFQPGEVWPKEHLLTNAADVMEHFAGDDDCQISLRFDDYVLDSRQSPVTVLTQEGSMNAWALGHMVNHPPKGKLPNCQSTQLNFTERMELQDLQRYIPNVYARPPGWQSRFFFSDPIIMHGLCLVARGDVKNDELLYDYRLQSEETPDWYSVVRYGDDMDDEQVVFFRDDWMK